MFTSLDKVPETVQNFTIDGKCSNCGQCCSNFLPLGKHEIERIRRYMRKHEIKEQLCKFPTSKAFHNLTCPFRSEIEKKCLIYSVRPAICQDFQCDKPEKKILADKSLYHGKYDAVDMRAVFFGQKPALEDLITAMMDG